MLNVRDVSVAYGKKQVLHQVSLEIDKGEILALVGHNGAGKTTLLRTIVGLTPRTSGSVVFEGADMPSKAVVQNVNRGVAFVTQGRNTFSTMTIGENLAVAISAGGREAAERLPMIEAMFPLLKERRGAIASTLSGGQRQMLALGLALLRGPKLIILDEPSTGLAPVLVSNVFKQVIEMRDKLGLSVIVVDQNVRQLLSFSDRVSILKAGRVVYAGAPAEIADDQSLWSHF
jgi:branched-chain amino acid transport system ATP-binding protein